MKRDVNDTEGATELLFTTPPSINVTAEESGNFTEEEPGNSTTPQDQEPVKVVPIGTQFVTQADYPTYHLTYSDNMAVEATALGMVRDGWIAAK